MMKMTTLYAAVSAALMLGATTLATAQKIPSEPAKAVQPKSMENKSQGISGDEYKREKDRIEADAKAAKEKCKSMKDNAQDICEAEAKADEKVAKKELDYKKNPNERNRQDVAKVKAEAAYEVAKEKCEDQKGDAQSSCKKQAKAEKDRAVAAAKGKKVASASGAMNGSTRSTSPAAGTVAPSSSSPSGNLSNTMSPGEREPSPNTNVQTQGTPTGSASSSSMGKSGK
jgi:membrane protein involved in colicin uptake